jgi:D-lactate dehydrogenase (cytochrome)
MTDRVLHQRLRDSLGNDGLVVDPELRADYSEDIAGGGAVAAAVARPQTVEALRQIVAIAAELGYALLPRGGGHSYSAGFVPVSSRSVVVDLSNLDRVLEIDPIDRFVRVEAGCTWATLLDALAPYGLRTPFFGPLSGYRATIGGALSQGATFFGAAMHGFSEHSVLGLTVVLANGDALRTGIGSDGRPHPRPSGPNLSALFLSDCGALGIKAEVTLRVVKRPPSERFASFSFADMPSMLRAQTALVDHDGVAECFGFDPQAHANLARGGFDVLEGAQIVADVARQQGSLKARLSRLAQLVRDGRHSVADLRYSLHFCVEGENEPLATYRLADASAVALGAGGEPVPDTIPRVTRSRPFRPIKALLGPDGERWLPLHGVFRISDAERGYRGLADVLHKCEGKRTSHGLKVSLLTVTSGEAIIIEAHLFWPDSLGRFHRRHVTEAQRRRYGAEPARPEARAFAHALRADLSKALRDAGAEHLQIGRYYPYEENLDPVHRKLVQGLKTMLDPAGILAPNVLVTENRFSHE